MHGHERIMKRKIDNKTYLNYLLQFLNVNDLKQICRDFEMKGFSKLKRGELIEFILDSLAEEELEKFIKQKELEIISKGIEIAINKINGNDRESIRTIKIVNPDTHEVEILFKGFNWEITSFLSITSENIEDPERDCDCRIGSNGGLCSHFWVGFILSLKQEWFNLDNWTLTVLPKDFENKIKSIKLSKPTTGDLSKEQVVSLIDESSDNFQLNRHLNKRITIYNGEITKILEKQAEFQEHVTIFFMVSLKKVKYGPQIKKKSDYREEDILTIDDLKLRVSDNAFEKVKLNVGDKITCSGGLSKDNFWGYVLKRVSKLNKL